MKNRKRDRRPARSRPAKHGEVDINEATSSYEKWMRGCTTVIVSDLRSKHEQMKERLPSSSCGVASTGGLNCGRPFVPICVTRPRSSP